MPAGLQRGYDELIERIRDSEAWVDIHIKTKRGWVVLLQVQETAEDVGAISARFTSESE